MLANTKVFTETPEGLNSNSYERYAIYYVPHYETELAEFGKSWFGYDLSEGETDRALHGLDMEFARQVTQKPARYGIHATLKAPFYLEENSSLEQLLEKTDRFAKKRQRFTLGKLKIGWHGNTMVLVESEKNLQVNQFASQCVLKFEDFRAPLTMKERTRRLEQNLNMHQRLMLEELGYPFVLSEFQFHITLTKNMTEEEKRTVVPALQPELDKILQTPCEIDGIAVVGDPGNNQPFQMIEYFELS